MSLPCGAAKSPTFGVHASRSGIRSLSERRGASSPAGREFRPARVGDLERGPRLAVIDSLVDEHVQLERQIGAKV